MDQDRVVALERRVTGYGGNPPGQGPFINLIILVRDSIIREASYETYQCPGCHACGKAICELILGATLDAAGAIRHEQLADRVGSLPPHRRICYGLALLALADAIKKLSDSPSAGQSIQESGTSIEGTT